MILMTARLSSSANTVCFWKSASWLIAEERFFVSRYEMLIVFVFRNIRYVGLDLSSYRGKIS